MRLSFFDRISISTKTELTIDTEGVVIAINKSNSVSKFQSSMRLGRDSKPIKP